MKNILNFLTELRENNNRPWFEANKERYKEVQSEFNQFAEQLIVEIEKFDPEVKGVTLREVTYRIYRDVRFSPNKEPYKTHIGAYVCPQGKKSGYAGYYFHIEPENCLLAAGLHCPQPNVLKSVREEILDNGAGFVAALKAASGFELDRAATLKRTPKGFPSDTPYEEFLRLKEFDLLKSINPQRCTLEEVIAAFKVTRPFNELLNKAVKYAHEEM